MLGRGRGTFLTPRNLSLSPPMTLFIGSLSAVWGGAAGDAAKLLFGCMNTDGVSKKFCSGECC